MANWDSFQEICNYYSPNNKSKGEKKKKDGLNRLHQNSQYNSIYILDLSLFLASIKMKQ